MCVASGRLSFVRLIVLRVWGQGHDWAAWLPALSRAGTRAVESGFLAP